MMDYANINVRFADKSIKRFSIEVIEIIESHTSNSHFKSRQTVISFKKMVANSIEIEDERFFGFYCQDDQWVSESECVEIVNLSDAIFAHRKNNYWLSDDKLVFHYDFVKSNCNRLVLNFAFKYECRGFFSITFIGRCTGIFTISIIGSLTTSRRICFITRWNNSFTTWVHIFALFDRSLLFAFDIYLRFSWYWCVYLFVWMCVLGMILWWLRVTLISMHNIIDVSRDMDHEQSLQWVPVVY